MESHTLQPQVERYCFTFGLMHSRKEDVLDRLEDFERTMAQPPYKADPADLRRLLTLQMKALIEYALAQPQHKDYFDISERNLGTARTAAKRWNVTAKHILFAIAYDHSKQGQPFFRALKRLSKISPAWADSISLLCGIASARRANEDYDKRPGIHRSAVGLILSDVNVAIESLTPTPEASAVAAASPVSSNQAEKNDDDDEMIANDAEDRDMNVDDFIVTGIDEGLLNAIGQRIATIIVNRMDDDAMYEEETDEVVTDEDDVADDDISEDDMDENYMGVNGAIVVGNDFTGSNGDAVRGDGGKGQASHCAVSMVQPDENPSGQEVANANKDGAPADRERF